jgi:hypothetical protein
MKKELTNTRGHANVVLEPQVEFTASQIRALTEFVENFFMPPPLGGGDAKSLGTAADNAFQELVRQLSRLTADADRYPFLEALTPVITELKGLTGKSHAFYLTELPAREAALFEMKDGVIDPILKFMNGPQKAIFDEAREFVARHKPNFDYVGGDEATTIAAALKDREAFKGNTMQQLKPQVEALKEAVTTRIAAEAAGARAATDALENRLRGMAEFAALTGAQQADITRPFAELSASIGNQTLIAVLRDSLRRFEDNDYPRLLAKTAAWARPPDPAPEGPAAPKPSGAPPAPTAAPEPTVAYVSGRSLKVPFDKAWLANEADIDRYLASMRQALLEEIRKGKRIQI